MKLPFAHPTTRSLEAADRPSAPAVDGLGATPPLPKPCRWIASRVGTVAGGSGPILGTLLFLAVVILVTARHEMWRDEIQAWLIARDSATPLHILRNTRYEGHPWLWHLLLWFPSRLTWNPVAMQVLHVLIAAANAFLLLRYAPLPGFIRLPLIFGYFFAYEWSVIARNYAIGVCLLILFAVLYGRGWRSAAWMGAALGAAALTNAFALIAVFVLVPTLAIEYAVAWTTGSREARRWWRQALLGGGLALTGAAAGVCGVIPPPDSGFAQGWHLSWSAQRYRETMERVIRAYVPLPAEHRAFWNSNRLLEASLRPGSNRPWRGIPRDARAGLAWCILGGTLLFFCRRPWAVLPYLAGTAGILLFFYLKYMGFMRHAGHLWLWFIIALWMAYVRHPCREAGGRWERLAERVERGSMIILVPVLLVHIWAATVSWRMDLHHPFSQAPAAAAFLRQRFPAAQERLWAGLPSTQVSAVVGHAQLPEILYVDTERKGSFIVYDRAPRGDRRDGEIAALLQNWMRREGRPAVLISGRRLSSGSAVHHGLVWLASFEKAVVNEEYHIYEAAPPVP